LGILHVGPGISKLQFFIFKKTLDSELDLDPHPDPQSGKSRILLQSMQTRNPAFKMLLGGLRFKMDDESEYSAKR
jgi:hypothetical protein